MPQFPISQLEKHDVLVKPVDDLHLVRLGPLEQDLLGLADFFFLRIQQLDLDQLMVLQLLVDVLDDPLCDPVLADKDRGLEVVSERAKVSSLSSCQLHPRQLARLVVLRPLLDQRIAVGSQGRVQRAGGVVWIDGAGHGPANQRIH